MKRFVLVGAGSRASMYVDLLAEEFAQDARLVALLDPNPGRLEFYRETLARKGVDTTDLMLAGQEALEDVIASTSADHVLVTSPDFTHADLICRSLRAGADVVVEKPLTTTADQARAIGDAVRETRRRVTTTFNLRYSPMHTAVKRHLMDGLIGDIVGVNLEWVLDTAHGADYFRRWHRDKTKSGGLLVHKASHHFDLINWWLDDVPERVFASGGVKFYGEENARRRGLGGAPDRGTHEGRHGPFELDLRNNDFLKQLFLDNEQHDGYRRDQNVFGPGVTTEDNVSVVVDYRRGATLTYSLNAHGPFEGYRVSINGTLGRLELHVVTRPSVLVDDDGRSVLDPDVENGTKPMPGAGAKLTVQLHWQEVEELPIPDSAGSHGGGDILLCRDLFVGGGEDRYQRSADLVDGLRAIAIGICGNESLASGLPVRPEQLQLLLERTDTVNDGILA